MLNGSVPLVSFICSRALSLAAGADVREHAVKRATAISGRLSNVPTCSLLRKRSISSDGLDDRLPWGTDDNCCHVDVDWPSHRIQHGVSHVFWVPEKLPRQRLNLLQDRLGKALAF